jgi:signal transduction histidine kinase
LTLAYSALLAAVALALIALLYAFMKYVPVYSEAVQSPRPPGAASPWVPPAKSWAVSEECNENSSPGSLLQDLVWSLTAPADASPIVTVCGVEVAGQPAWAGGWEASLQVSTKEDFLQALLLFSAVALALLLLVALFLGWFVAGRMLRPLQKVTATARGIAGSTLHERIAPTGPQDEIRELAETFDNMLERLDRSFDAQRRFAANASHELKTPLTGMRAIVQVALAAPDEYRLQEVGEKLLALTTRSNEILDALLALAHADQGGIMTTEVSLDGLAQECAAQHRAQADASQVELTLGCERAVVAGSTVLLRQLITNLVSNAIRHNHPGGWAAVRVERDVGHGVVRIAVTNSGRVFGQDEIELMREPFHRLDSRQAGGPGRRATGHGLGLAVAESIAHAHSGELGITSPPGGGLEVTVTLPLPDGADAQTS